MTSVLVVDDHPVVLQGCRRILEDGGITTIFEASNVATGYEIFCNHRPDVVVIDLSFGKNGLDGLSLIRSINRDDRRVPILVLSKHNDPTLVLQALEAGAVGYILKDTATEELLEGIREVQSGHRYLSHGLAIEVAVSRVTSWPHSLPALTSRELDVLALLAKGKTYGHIAQELDVSYKTVLNVSWQLRRKLGVDNLPALVQSMDRNNDSLPKPPGFLREQYPLTLTRRACNNFSSVGLMRGCGGCKAFRPNRVATSLGFFPEFFENPICLAERD
jgi:two-component system, NarL family, invasion response regulator UvrY